MSKPRSQPGARAAFTVPTIDCESCVRAITRGLGQVAGVARTEVDLAARCVVVAYDPWQTDEAALREHLEQLGFIPEVAPAGEPAAAEAPAEDRPAEAGDPALLYALLAGGVVLLALAGYSGYVLYPRFNLPAAEGAALLLLATGAGIASFFSPCSFPLLVTLLGRETGAQGRTGPSGARASRALAFAGALAAGAALFMLLLGLVIALGGEALVSGVTFTSTAGRLLRAVVGPLLITLGLIQLGLLPSPFHAVEALSRPLMRAQARARRRTPILGFGVLGFAYVLAGFG